MDNDWNSHMPALALMVQLTEGPILEVGGGYYSTPLLHTMCDGARELVTLEEESFWYASLKNSSSSTHRVIYWDGKEHIEPSQASHWGLAFIDHGGPGVGSLESYHSKRKKIVYEYMDQCDVLMLHDTQELEIRNANDWLEFLKTIKYHVEFRHTIPWTLAISNTIDLKQAILSGLRCTNNENRPSGINP